LIEYLPTPVSALVTHLALSCVGGTLYTQHTDQLGSTNMCLCPYTTTTQIYCMSVKCPEGKIDFTCTFSKIMYCKSTSEPIYDIFNISNFFSPSQLKIFYFWKNSGFVNALVFNMTILTLSKTELIHRIKYISVIFKNYFKSELNFIYRRSRNLNHYSVLWIRKLFFGFGFRSTKIFFGFGFVYEFGFGFCRHIFWDKPFQSFRSMAYEHFLNTILRRKFV
jgi:hypothetical protein